MKILSLILLFTSLIAFHSCTNNRGRSWNNEPQVIPGKVQCELYDSGGEGISYHDSDSLNNGSGILNPANGNFYNEFRMHEGVDISYTKSNGTDDNPFNTVAPEMNQLYVGWTEPGEWIEFTVDVMKRGNYKISLMYTSNRGGEIEILNNDNVSTGPMQVVTTYNDADSLAWRQWHHWNKSQIGNLKLKQGKQIIKLMTLTNGNMNYDYIEFTPAD